MLKFAPFLNFNVFIGSGGNGNIIVDSETAETSSCHVHVSVFSCTCKVKTKRMHRAYRGKTVLQTHYDGACARHNDAIFAHFFYFTHKTICYMLNSSKCITQVLAQSSFTLTHRSPTAAIILQTTKSWKHL